MQVHYFPAVGQANASAFVLAFEVEALEEGKYHFRVLVFYADAVVGEGEFPMAILLLCGYFDERSGVFLLKLDGVVY